MRRRLARPLRASFVFWNEQHCPVFSGSNEGEVESAKYYRTSYYTVGPPVFYNRGRLAWQPSSTKIVIDDLRTCERRHCSLTEMHLQGQKLVLQGMTREILVFVVKQGAAGFNYNTM
jgi:hypothetical protein